MDLCFLVFSISSQRLRSTEKKVENIDSPGPQGARCSWRGWASQVCGSSRWDSLTTGNIYDRAGEGRSFPPKMEAYSGL